MKPQAIVGKWYVIDAFNPGQLMAGPFNSRREADKDRRQFNIADDCVAIQLYRDEAGKLRGRIPQPSTRRSR